MEANGLERMADNKGTVRLIGSETLSSNPPSLLLVSMMIGRDIIILQLFNRWLSGVKTSNVYYEGFLTTINSKVWMHPLKRSHLLYMWVSTLSFPTAPSILIDLVTCVSQIIRTSLQGKFIGPRRSYHATFSNLGEGGGEGGKKYI